ncbi:MAG: sensor histidine kinase [Bryobacteraceae bacterium]|nr:sensor histidine kinase [Bryobacteraceae bacterium]
MSPRNVLRILILGFTLVVMLVVAAAFVGYQGSKAIHTEAQELVRGHFVSSGRGAELESRIEEQSQNLLDELETVLAVCLLLALGCAGLTVYSTKRAFDKLAWQSQELDRVSWNMLQDQEVVARRFSHEMHDELGQSLTGLRSMMKRLNASEFEARRGECVQVLDEVLANVRELSQLLRPVILDDFGLDAGLRWVANRFTQRTGIEVSYRSAAAYRLTDELETHLFRIGQEALTNIARHSQAKRAWMSLEMGRGLVTLTIEDDGCGIPEGPKLAKAASSIGMVGMRARARHIGGSLEMENRPNGGLRLRVEAPAQKASANDSGHSDKTHPHLIS